MDFYTFLMLYNISFYKLLVAYIFLHIFVYFQDVRSCYKGGLDYLYICLDVFEKKSVALIKKKPISDIFQTIQEVLFL